MGSFGKGLAQKKHKDHLFNLVLETQIQPFLMDSSGTGKTEWENENFVTVYADMRNAVLKTWPLQNGDVLVGLLLNDPDMVMNHQQNRFFFYRNEQLEPAVVMPTLQLSLFFDTPYLEKNKIDPLQEVEDPEFVFYPDNNRVTVHLQPESFDSTYMGNDSLTHLDPGKFGCSELVLEPDKEGQFKIVSRRYNIDHDLELDMSGGWEIRCATSGSFASVGDGRYVFSNEIDAGGPNEVQMIINGSYDSVNVTERIAFAYGKLRSETEGIAFYDTSFAGNRETTWYTFSDFIPVPVKGKNTFVITGKTPANAMLKAPVVSPKIANDYFRKQSPQGYDFAPGLDETARRSRSLKLYAYHTEIEITFLKDGKRIKKILVFRLRHGEC
jgi:hypothetical protein